MDIFVHDIAYVDNEHEQCFKLMCYTDKGVPGQEGHVIYTIRHELTCYFDFSEELGRVIAESKYRRSVDVVSKRPGYYYHDSDQNFFRLRMFSHRRMKWAVNDLRSRFPSIQAWELNIQPVTQFMIATKLKIGRWYRLPYEFQQGELSATMRSQIQPLPERVGCPVNLTMCCFDLETSGLSYEKDTISMIGMVLVRGNTKHNVILHLHAVHDTYQAGKEMENEEDVIEYIQCENEKQMLEEFTRTLVRERVSIVTGCNTTGFDWHMLFARAKKLQVLDSFYRMSWWFPDLRVGDFRVMMRGMGDLKTIDIAGVRCMDLKIIALGTFIKLGSYSLNNIARAILSGSRVDGAQKHEIHWTDVVKCADPNYSPVDRAKVARYCIRDCYLVVWCFEQRNYLDLFYDRCSIFNITMATAMYTGLTQTLPGMMMEKMHDDNMVMNHDPIQTRRMEEALALEELIHRVNEDGEGEGEGEGEDDEPATVFNTLGKAPAPKPGAAAAAKKGGKRQKGYAGGFVIDPQSGLRRAVCINDYQSLYPSLMEKYYLCFSMLLKPGDELKYPANEVTAVRIDDNTTFYFKVPNSIHDTVVPSLQTRLKVFRKEAKKEMKKYEPGSVEYAAYDNKQNNIKLSMNGFYGFLGTKGMAQAVAASVTALGRDTILKTVDIAKTEFGCNVVYGDTDSVMVQFPEVTSIMSLEQREQALERMKAFTARITQYWHTEVAPLHENPVLILEPETMCNGYFHTKKKYAMLAYDTGNLHTPKKFVTKGMEPTVRAFSAVAQNTIRDFLHAVVTDQDEKCEEIVRNAIQFIRDSAAEVTPENIQQFVVTGQWGQEDYATPTDAYTVAIRTRQRLLEGGEKYNVSSLYNLGDRVPFVHVDAASRDVLERHILRFRKFPGQGQYLGNDESIHPAPTSEWQELVISGVYRFVNVGNANRLVIVWSNVPAKMAVLYPEDVYFDGVRAKKIECSGGMNGRKQMSWVFELPIHSSYFTAESPDFARTLNVDYYIKEIRRPLERYIENLLKTSSTLLRSDLRAIRRMFTDTLSSSSRSSGKRSISSVTTVTAVRPAKQPHGSTSTSTSRIAVSGQMSITKRQLGLLDCFYARGGNKKVKVG